MTFLNSWLGRLWHNRRAPSVPSQLQSLSSVLVGVFVTACIISIGALVGAVVTACVVFIASLCRPLFHRFTEPRPATRRLRPDPNQIGNQTSNWLRTSLPPLRRVLKPTASLPWGYGIERSGQAGQSLTFSITLVSWAGDPYTEELEQEFRATIGGTATLIPTINPIGDGTYEVTYTARKAGTYYITLLANNKQLGDSPYAVTIKPGSIDARHCTIRGGPGLGPLALPSKQETHIVLRAADAFGNPRDKGGPARFLLEAKGVREKKGEVSRWTRVLALDVHDNNDGTYRLGFRPPSGFLRLSLGLLPASNTSAADVAADAAEHQQEEVTIVPNGEWNLVVLKAKQMAALQTNLEKKRFYFKANQNGSTVWIYITTKQIALYTYFMGIVARRLRATRLHRSLKVAVDADSSTDFTIDLDDGQPALAFASRERDVFYATFSAFIHRSGLTSQGFDERQQLLFQELRKQAAASSAYTQYEVTAKRADMLRTLLGLTRQSVDLWQRKWKVTFEGEPGYDAGGLLREFFSVMAREAFKREARLFAPLGADDDAATRSVHPCPARRPASSSSSSSSSSGGNQQPEAEDSGKKTGSKRKKLFGWLGGGGGSAKARDDNKELLDLYRGCGLLLAKTIWDAAVHDSVHLVDVHLTRSLRKQLLGLPPHFTDWQTDDPQFYMSKVKYLLENDPADLEMTFVEELFDEAGAPAGEVELKPGGRHIAVTEANRTEYLHLLARYRLQTTVEARLEAFREGFQALVPEQLLGMFDENELELLLSGLPTIYLDDLRANVRYSGWSQSDEVIVWFWAAVESFSDEERARLVQFITGSSKVPLGGFAALSTPVTISKVYSNDTLPMASTCFNRLNLPSYSCFAILSERLLYAVNEGSEGFGFA